MKRQKAVFTSKEIAHVWANQGAPQGRYSSSMSFDGDEFKSYNAVLARRIHLKGKSAYVVDSASFSNTTSKHQYHVRGAIRDSDKVFYVQAGWNSRGTPGVYGLLFTPATLRDYYLASYREKQEKPSRYEFKRASAFLHKVNQLEKAIEVCEYFGLATRKLKLESRKHSKEYAKCQNIVADRRDKLNKASEEKRNCKQAARVASVINQAESIIADPSKIEHWHLWDESLLDSRPDLLEKITALRVEKDKTDIQAWTSGRSNDAKRDWPAFLRAEYAV